MHSTLRSPCSYAKASAAACRAKLAEGEARWWGEISECNDLFCSSFSTEYLSAAGRDKLMHISGSINPHRSSPTTRSLWGYSFEWCAPSLRVCLLFSHGHPASARPHFRCILVTEENELVLCSPNLMVITILFWTGAKRWNRHKKKGLLKPIHAEWLFYQLLP